MEIGVLSDSHLHTLTDDFAARVERIARDVDHFFHLGDSVCAEVLDFLASFSLFAVSGNMDPHPVSLAWPLKQVVELEGRRFGLIHGWGARHGLENKVVSEFRDVDCVCFGHTHSPMAREINGVLVFNPGSTQSDWRSSGTYGRLSIGPDGIKTRHLTF